MLTNMPVSDRTISMAPLFKELGIIDDYLFFEPKGGIGSKLALLKKIRSINARQLVYLAEARGVSRVIRDRFYFMFSGISEQVGFPSHREHRTYQYDEVKKEFEHEASRLARCLRHGGAYKVDLDSFEDRQYPLWKVSEKLRTKSFPAEKFIVIGMGAKKDVCDWGDQRWQELVGILSNRYSSAFGLISVGAVSDREKSQRILDGWSGPTSNYCGGISLHDTAYILSKAEVYVGHDSGLIHLAAAVGTRSVGIYSAMALPGVWFPLGQGHRIIYNQTDCYGCNLHECTEHKKKCIYGITPESVLSKIQKLLPNHSE